jgi:YbbR-like protein
VQIRIVGEGRNGYMVAAEQAQPDQVDVVGPASRVARVAAAITDPVDVSAVTGSSQFQVNAFVEDAYVRFVTPARIAVTVTMKKK